MSEKKRYIATFTMYIHAKDDEKATKKAVKIAKKIEKKFEGCFDLEELNEQPFGSMDSRKVNFIKHIKE